MIEKFTVKQVAEMLETNEETVRRWIRSGKLGSTFTNKKAGHIITADSLRRFVSETPKYASALPSTFVASPVALSVVIGSILGGLIALAGRTKQITARDVESSIKTKIREHELLVAKKEEQVVKLQQEIAVEQKEIEKYRYALQNLDLEAIAESINAEK